MNTCGVILAGGKSSRMGTDKALLKLDNKTVIEHIIAEFSKITEDIIIVTNKPIHYQFLKLPIVSDRYQEKGPLGGLETALYHGLADNYLISACDTPFINHYVYQKLLDELNNYDAVIPKYMDRLHPLSGIYKSSLLPDIQYQIEQNNLRVQSFFDDRNINYIDQFSSINDDVLMRHFFNMNNPDEYNDAKRF